MIAVRGFDWMDKAACRGSDPERWFPLKGRPANGAKAICADCPVRPQCGEMGKGEAFGIWGGQTEDERLDLRVGRLIEPVPLDLQHCPGVCGGTPFIPRMHEQRYHDQRCGERSRYAQRREAILASEAERAVA